MLKNTTLLLARQLYSEFLAIKKEHAAKGQFITNEDARLMICQRPAPRFYITAESMQRIIHALEHGKPLHSNGRRKAMHLELWRRYKEQLSICNNPEQAIKAVIHSPAPGYYLGQKQIKRLIYYAIKN